MESHGGRSLETPHGVAPTDQRTVTALLSSVPLDVRESGHRDRDPFFHRVDVGPVPPPAPRRPVCPVRVHSRPQMALVTAPPPQTCVLEPVTSSGPIRTTNLVRTSSRTTSGHASLRRNVCDFPGVSSPLSVSSTGRLESSAIPSTPVLNGRGHQSSSSSSSSGAAVSASVSASSRLQNTNQFSNSLTNSASRSRTGAGSVNNSSVEAVSLMLPRPETERTANEYVETPLRSGLSLIEPKFEPSHRVVGRGSGDEGGVGVQRDANFAMVTLPVTGLERSSKPHGERSGSLLHHNHHHTLQHQTHHQHQIQVPPHPLHRSSPGESEKVITSQPSATFKKERFQSESQCSRQNDDIICSECKRCRCESCRTPRPLPSKWLCGTCHCSADAVVDYATCLCCAKAVFYHCSNEETAARYESDPCSCSRDMLYARWGCLGLLSVFLPCLFCYWPCRGLVRICESCHQYYSSNGCRCQKHYPEPSPLTFEKRLLDSPE